jgi:hypothetical protein
MKFETNIKSLKKAYLLSKAAKVGDLCICPSCGSEFTKTNYQQAFCKSLGEGRTVCKDHYWNNVTPNKRNNTTRISPASARWLAQKDNWVENYDPSDSEYWDQKDY